MGLMHVPANEAMNLDTSPPSEMVMKQRGFLKGFKAFGPDRLSLFFKSVGEWLTSELSKSLGSIWKREEIRKD